MARATQPRRVYRYSAAFKLTAVKLSNTPGVQIKDVAEGLDIHPFMLSRWRKEVREGTLRPDPARREVEKRAKPKPRTAKSSLASVRTRRELQRYAQLKRDYALLKEEHELLKKAVRFCSARSKNALPSSKRSGTGSVSPGFAKGSASAAPVITRGESAHRASTRAPTRGSRR